MNKKILSIFIIFTIIFAITGQSVSALTLSEYKGSSSASLGKYETYGTGTGPYNGSYYNQLNPEQRNAYNRLVGLAKSDSTITVVLLNPIRFSTTSQNPSSSETSGMMLQVSNIVQPALNAFLMDNPIVFWMDLDGGTGFSVGFSGYYSGGRYYWTVSQVDINIKVAVKYTPNTVNLVNAVNNKISAFSTTKTDRYGILKDIHNYLCDTVVYDLNAPYAHEPYGALISGRAVCEGYAEAFMLLCQKYNIPVACIVGMGGTGSDVEPHMWNYVQMEDGKWYGVDVTWDDQSTIVYDFFLSGSQTVATGFGTYSFAQSHTEDPRFAPDSDYSFVYPLLNPTAYVFDTCASGHTPGNWEITVQPTYTSDGQRVKRCTECGEIVVTEVIPKLIQQDTDAVLKSTSTLKISGTFITGVISGAKVSDIASQFDGTVTITSSTGSTLSSTALVGTGSIINTGTKTITIIIKGDVDGNGKISSVDYLLIKRAFLNTVTLNEVQLKAACISGGTKPVSSDYLKIKRHFLGSYNLYA